MASACGEDEEEDTPTLGTCDLRSVFAHCIEIHDASPADLDSQEAVARTPAATGRTTRVRATISSVAVSTRSETSFASVYRYARIRRRMRGSDGSRLRRWTLATACVRFRWRPRDTLELRAAPRRRCVLAQAKPNATRAVPRCSDGTGGAEAAAFGMHRTAARVRGSGFEHSAARRRPRAPRDRALARRRPGSAPGRTARADRGRTGLQRERRDAHGISRANARRTARGRHRVPRRSVRAARGRERGLGRDAFLELARRERLRAEIPGRAVSLSGRAPRCAPRRALRSRQRRRARYRPRAHRRLRFVRGRAPRSFCRDAVRLARGQNGRRARHRERTSRLRRTPLPRRHDVRPARALRLARRPTRPKALEGPRSKNLARAPRDEANTSGLPRAHFRRSLRAGRKFARLLRCAP